MQDLTEGPLKKQLLTMSGAFLLNMLTNTLFSLNNIYWVGRLGATAQAAVTLAAIPVVLLLNALPVICVGSAILISHAVGARDQQRANRIFNESFGASLLATAGIAAIAWFNREAFSHLLTADTRTAELIASYFRWFLPSIVVQVPLYVMSGALESTGNVRVGTIAQSASVVLNAILAPLLMFGWLGLPALGLTGTGLSAFIACGATMLGLLVYAARKNSYLTLRPAIWLSRPRELWGALKIGLPTGIEGGVVAAHMVVIALLLRPFGPEVLAAFGIGQRLFQAGLMPLLALSSATSVIAGQSYGAALQGRIRETLRASLLLGLAIAPLLLVVFEVWAPWMCSRFTDDAAVIAAGTEFLRIVALSLVPASIAYAVFAVLSGMGNTRASLFTSIAYAALVVVSACALSRLPGFKPAWLWTVMAIAGAAQALLAWKFMRSELRRDVDRQPVPEPAAEWVAAP